MAEQESVSPEQLNEFLFMQIVMMFQSAAYQHMGKVMNPITQKVERDLAQAKNAIDILGMLGEKTRGNLNENENRLLEHTLYELRMNYVDEINKDKASEAEQVEEVEGSEAEAPEGEKAEAPETETLDAEGKKAEGSDSGESS